jgi:mxaA protein
MKINIIIGAVWVLWSMTVFAAQTSEVSVDRGWGVLIGDVMTVTATLPIQTEDLDTSSLPQAGKRYGVWLYLQSLDMHDNVLTLRYQVTNVPKKNDVIATPEWTLTTLGDEHITVPSVSVSIGTLLAVTDDDNAMNLSPKPEHPPVLIDTSPLKQRLVLFAALTAVLVFIWLIWHFGWTFKNRKPFAKAVSQVGRLRWLPAKQPNQAARLLHAAFNETAGTIVVQNNLDDMLNNVPWLAPLSNDITAFYQQSEQHFFQRDAKQEPSVAMVLKLAKKCRAKEKVA